MKDSNHYFHGGGGALNLCRANLQPLSQKGMYCMDLDKTRTKRIWILKDSYGIKIVNPFSVRKMKFRRPVESMDYSYGRQSSYLADCFTKSYNNDS
jgi:formylmethanofuran dehydrogenase subunit A